MSKYVGKICPENFERLLRKLQTNFSGYFLSTLMHQILQKRCPSYLADLVTFNTTYSQRRHLRSSTTRSAAVRRAWTQFGKCSFSVCGPDVGNNLPIALHNIEGYPAFRRALKSHLFSCAFFLITVIPYIHWHCNAQSAMFCRLGTRTFIVLYCIAAPRGNVRQRYDVSYDLDI